MESKAKLAGHAVHPMLITLPLGLLGTAVIFDIIRAFTDSTDLAVASFYMIAAGIIGGLLAAVFGLVDWLVIPTGTRAKRLGLWHGVGNVVVVAMFAVSWLLRHGEDSYAPTRLALWLGVIAVALGLGTAWAGGELVERLGSGSTKAPTWMRSVPCPALPPRRGHSGPSSPSRSLTANKI